MNTADIKRKAVRGATTMLKVLTSPKVAAGIGVGVAVFQLAVAIQQLMEGEKKIGFRREEE